MNIKSEIMKFYASFRLFMHYLCIRLMFMQGFMHIYVKSGPKITEIRPDQPVLLEESCL